MSSSTSLRVTAPPVPKDLSDVELSTPVSVAPTVLKDLASGSEHKSRRSLDFNTQVPIHLKTEDVDFNKLWQILAGRGWRYVNGDMEFANYYLAPGVRKVEGRLNAEKFGDANKLLCHVIRLKDSTFRDVLEEYFDKFPAQFKPFAVQVKDMHWNSLWPIMRNYGWKSFSGGLLCPYLYATDKVETKQQATDQLHKQAFMSSREATCFLLNNQTQYSKIMTEYFDKRPLSMAEDEDVPHPSPRPSVAPQPSPVKVVHQPKPSPTASSTGHIEFDDLFSLLDDDEFPRNKALENDHDDAVSASPVASVTSNVTANEHSSPIAQEDENHLPRSKEEQPPGSPKQAISLKDIDTHKFFNFVWLLLKKEHGWTHSSGNLLHSFSFLKPGLRAKSDGQEGVDYFVGEQALVQYVATHMPEMVNEYKKEQERSSKETCFAVPKSSSNVKSRSSHVSSSKHHSKRDSPGRLTFHQVFSRLRDQGWTYRPAPDVLKNFYYLMPGLKSVKEGRLGLNMFDSEEDVVDYYYKVLHGDDSSIVSDTSLHSPEAHHPDDHGESILSETIKSERMSTKQSRKTKRKHFEASARLNGISNVANEDSSSDDESAVDSMDSPNASLDFNTIWPKLQARGWKHFRGSGLISYYYAKPHVQTKSEGQLGVSMFDSEEAVVEEYLLEQRNAAQSDYSSDVSEEEVVDTKLGNFVWSVLRNEHDWLYRNGDKLSAFCYLKPPLTKKSKGIEGVNLFTGLGALLKYVRQHHPDIIERYQSNMVKSKRARIEPPSNLSSPVSTGSSVAAVQHDKGLFDFCWGKLAQNHGWEAAFVQLDSNGETRKVIVGKEALLKHVCSKYSNLILEYANEQRKD